MNKILKIYKGLTLDKIIELEGVQILARPLGSLKGLYINPLNVPTIIVNTTIVNDLETYNEVIAHELAHHILHRGINELKTNKEVIARMEQEAEALALQLLQLIKENRPHAKKDH